jgi:hypothetical protein
MMIKVVYNNYNEETGRTVVKIINTDYKNDDGVFFEGYGESLCSSKDEPNERIGFEVALVRAKENLYWKINRHLGI